MAVTKKSSKRKKKSLLEGTWYIQEMGVWDEDYFSMEVQAYIQINLKKGDGFQFGLVTG